MTFDFEEVQIGSDDEAVQEKVNEYIEHSTYAADETGVFSVSSPARRGGGATGDGLRQEHLGYFAGEFRDVVEYTIRTSDDFYHNDRAGPIEKLDVKSVPSLTESEQPDSE